MTLTNQNTPAVTLLQLEETLSHYMSTTGLHASHQSVAAPTTKPITGRTSKSAVTSMPAHKLQNNTIVQPAAYESVASSGSTTAPDESASTRQLPSTSNASSAKHTQQQQQQQQKYVPLIATTEQLPVEHSSSAPSLPSPHLSADTGITGRAGQVQAPPGCQWQSPYVPQPCMRLVPQHSGVPRPVGNGHTPIP
jgi:hypothetical protein